MIYYLNIASATGWGTHISAVDAIDALTAQGFTVTDFSVLEAPATLVLLVLERGGRRGRDVYSAFFNVAEALGHSFISVMSVNLGRGSLIGPCPPAEVAFDSSTFYLTDGRSLGGGHGKLTLPQQPEST